MKKIKINFILAFIFTIFFWSPIQAELKLPAIVSSNMVLQRNSEVELWGWSDEKEKINIKVSWQQETINTQADKDGNWRVQVKTTSSKTPQNILIKGESNSIQLENVLLGEVWLCSGQSNMQQPMKGFLGQPTFRSQLDIAKSSNPNLRLFTVQREASKRPVNDLIKYEGWKEANPNAVSEFSAVGYFFGQQLQEILDVPVGLIHSSWGASNVEAWMSKEALIGKQTVDLESIDFTTAKVNQVPTALFNSMIYPLIPYTIKGAIWYQGEANRLRPEEYKELFPAMVNDWRERWNIGDFPFYYVQIAPFTYSNPNAFQEIENSAFIRESQLLCLDLIPNSGMAVTLDLGDSNSIHPPRKKEVADRLLLLALDQTYGYKAVDGSSPIYDSIEIKERGILVKFKNVGMGLYSFEDLKDFEIAGADRVFYPAQATIVDRKYLMVSSENVPEPVALRYAWRNWVNGTLYNTNLLPVSSFRTDNWSEAVRAK